MSLIVEEVNTDSPPLKVALEQSSSEISSSVDIDVGYQEGVVSKCEYGVSSLRLYKFFF